MYIYSCIYVHKNSPFEKSKEIKNIGLLTYTNNNIFSGKLNSIASIRGSKRI